MLILQLENLRNFRLSKDSIVVLTRIAWATLLYLLTGFLRAFKLGRGIVGSRFLFYYSLYWVTRDF